MKIKQFIKSKNNQTHKIKPAAFKNYQKKLTVLLQISRQSHYQQYFNNKKKNSKTLS